MRRVRGTTTFAVIATACAVIAAGAFSGCTLLTPAPIPTLAATPPTPSDTPPSPDASSPPTPTPTPSVVPLNFAPKATDQTAPSRMKVQEAIQVNGKTVDSYERKNPIDFQPEAAYTALSGVITFRGDNHRSSGAFGTADITQKKFDTSPWKVRTGAMPKRVSSGSWSGNGWTGQPLLVQWPDETRRVLARNAAALDKDGLVEAIYASMDGNIYFLDADTGKATRDPVKIGFPFKGAGALDPRGIPVMYVGSGDSAPSGAASHVFVVSLVDGKVLYEFGARDSFAQRSWSGMDSSALVDAATDTLIYCGENGIIYTIHLNTNWDPATGKLTIKPDETVKYRYRTSRTSDARYWLGIETSPVILGHYLIAGDNGGNLICVDLNTMKMVWLQDILDDTNGSPVLEIAADGKPYVYISTSLHWTAKNAAGNIPIWKIDATTGEKLWQKEYPCRTVTDVSGGVQGTIALGQKNVKDLVFVPVARTPTVNAGKFVALDKATGKEVWAVSTNNYSWSSPVVVYDKSGDGYLITADSSGTIYLLDARTGKQLDTFASGANVEATPAVFNNRVIVGTRGQNIYGLKLV